MTGHRRGLRNRHHPWKGMRLVWLAVGVLAAAGCVTNNRYALDGDFNGLEPPEELSPEEQRLKEEIFQEADVVETFSDRTLERGFAVQRDGRIAAAEGVLESTSPGREAERVGQSLTFRDMAGRKIQSITIGWDLTSTQGHLITWATIEDWGKPTFFLDQGKIWAHTHLDSLGGDTEYLGREEHVMRGYTIQEIRVEGDEFVLLYNGEVFKRYPMDGERLIDRITVGNNGGGEGKIDFAAVKFGDGERKSSGDDSLPAEFLIPGADINEPVWAGQDRILATTGYNNQLVFLDRQGRVQESYEAAMDGLERMNMVSLSPDGRLIAFHAEREDGTQDIYLLNRDAGQLFQVTQSGACHGPSFSSDDLLIYAEVDESAEPELQNRVYRYRISTGERELIFERRSVKDEQGTSYWWPQVNRENGDILLCHRNEENGIYSYTVLSPEGVPVQDLTPYAGFDQVWGGAWIDGSNVLASGMRNGRQGYFWISLLEGTVYPVMTDLPEEAVTLYGVNLSPDKQWAASHCWCEGPSWEGNKLVLFPMP